MAGPLALLLPSLPPWHQETELHSGVGLGAARGPGWPQIHSRRLRMTDSKVDMLSAESQGHR